jgi:hypothetical protein
MPSIHLGASVGVSALTERMEGRLSATRLRPVHEPRLCRISKRSTQSYLIISRGWIPVSTGSYRVAYHIRSLLIDHTPEPPRGRGRTEATRSSAARRRADCGGAATVGFAQTRFVSVRAFIFLSWTCGCLVSTSSKQNQLPANLAPTTPRTGGNRQFCCSTRPRVDMVEALPFVREESAPRARESGRARLPGRSPAFAPRPGHDPRSARRR